MKINLHYTNLHIWNCQLFCLKNYVKPQQVDESGTQAINDRLKFPDGSSNNIQVNGIGDEASAVPINENLFTEEDLDALDDELQDLELND